MSRARFDRIEAAAEAATARVSVTVSSETCYPATGPEQAQAGRL